MRDVLLFGIPFMNQFPVNTRTTAGIACTLLDPFDAEIDPNASVQNRSDELLRLGYIALLACVGHAVPPLQSHKHPRYTLPEGWSTVAGRKNISRPFRTPGRRPVFENPNVEHGLRESARIHRSIGRETVQQLGGIKTFQQNGKAMPFPERRALMVGQQQEI